MSRDDAWEVFMVACCDDTALRLNLTGGPYRFDKDLCECFDCLVSEITKLGHSIRISRLMYNPQHEHDGGWLWTAEWIHCETKEVIGSTAESLPVAIFYATDQFLEVIKLGCENVD